jgi:hypothetical protein
MTAAVLAAFCARGSEERHVEQFRATIKLLDKLAELITPSTDVQRVTREWFRAMCNPLAKAVFKDRVPAELHADGLVIHQRDECVCLAMDPGVPVAAAMAAFILAVTTHFQRSDVRIASTAWPSIDDVVVAAEDIRRRFGKGVTAKLARSAEMLEGTPRAKFLFRAHVSPVIPLFECKPIAIFGQVFFMSEWFLFSFDTPALPNSDKWVK